MKNKIKFWSVLALIITFFVLGCSKDDSGSDNEQPIELNGGDVYRYQMVTIDLPNTALSVNEYDAILGDLDVQLYKVDEHVLSLWIPTNAPLGTIKLQIPMLNNAVVNYEIFDTELTQSADETLVSFFSESDAYFIEQTSPTVAVQIAQDNYQKIIDFYNNNASDSEKQEMALFYKANKTTIDNIITNNLPTGRLASLTDDQKKAKINTLFVSAFATGIGMAALYNIALPPPVKIIAVGTAGIGIAVAVNALIDITGDAMVSTQSSIDGLESDLNSGRQAANYIALTNEVASTHSFTINNRGFINSDSNKNQSYVVKFFSAKNKLNGFITQVNSVINWLNENIIFFDMDFFNTATLPSVPFSEIAGVSQENFENFSFNISHSNLQLEQATLSSTGALNLKVKITGTPTSMPIVSTLNYSYNDNFSSFTGHFNIEVNDVEFPLDGNWQVSYYNASQTFGVDYLHQQERFTCDVSGYASISETRYPTNPPPNNDWQPAGEVNISYSNGKIIIEPSVGFEVIVTDFNDTVFYSENWNTNYTINDYYWKIKLEKL